MKKKSYFCEKLKVASPTGYSQRTLTQWSYTKQIKENKHAHLIVKAIENIPSQQGLRQVTGRVPVFLL